MKFLDRPTLANTPFIKNISTHYPMRLATLTKGGTII